MVPHDTHFLDFAELPELALDGLLGGRARNARHVNIAVLGRGRKGPAVHGWLGQRRAIAPRPDLAVLAFPGQVNGSRLLRGLLLRRRIAQLNFKFGPALLLAPVREVALMVAALSGRLAVFFTTRLPLVLVHLAPRWAAAARAHHRSLLVTTALGRTALISTFKLIGVTSALILVVARLKSVTRRLMPLIAGRSLTVLIPRVSISAVVVVHGPLLAVFALMVAPLLGRRVLTTEVGSAARTATLLVVLVTRRSLVEAVVVLGRSVVILRGPIVIVAVSLSEIIARRSVLVILTIVVLSAATITEASTATALEGTSGSMGVVTTLGSRLIAATAFCVPG